MASPPRQLAPWTVCLPLSALWESRAFSSCCRSQGSPCCGPEQTFSPVPPPGSMWPRQEVAQTRSHFRAEMSRRAPLRERCGEDLAHGGVQVGTSSGLRSAQHRLCTRLLSRAQTRKPGPERSGFPRALGSEVEEPSWNQSPGVRELDLEASGSFAFHFFH